MNVRLVPLRDAVPLTASWAALPGNVFHSPELVLGARGLRGADGVSLLVVEGPTGLDFVLPVHAVERLRRIRVRAISTWTHDYCYLGDPLVRRGTERAAWTAALSFLQDQRPACWLHLPRLQSSGPIFEGLRLALADLDLSAVEIGAHERAAVIRRPGFTYFDQTISGIHRKGYRRQRRVMERELGTVTTVASTDVASFLALEAAGWKAGTAMADDPGASMLLRALIDSGAGSLLELRAGGRIVAVQVQLRRGVVSSCFKTAYDEVLRQYSPGALLELDVVQTFHEDAQLELLDSCAAPGHPLVDRMFPDRRGITTMLVGLTRRGRAVAAVTPGLAELWSRVSQRPIGVP